MDSNARNLHYPPQSGQDVRYPRPAAGGRRCGSRLRGDSVGDQEVGEGAKGRGAGVTPFPQKRYLRRYFVGSENRDPGDGYFIWEVVYIPFLKPWEWRRGYFIWSPKPESTGGKILEMSALFEVSLFGRGFNPSGVFAYWTGRREKRAHHPLGGVGVN